MRILALLFAAGCSADTIVAPPAGPDGPRPDGGSEALSPDTAGSDATPDAMAPAPDADGAEKTTPKVLGSSCAADDECSSGSCDTPPNAIDKVCMLRPYGAACDADKWCRTGSCSSNNMPGFDGTCICRLSCLVPDGAGDCKDGCWDFSTTMGAHQCCSSRSGGSCLMGRYPYPMCD